MDILVKNNGRWTEFEVSSYTVQALIFDLPSEDYGIEGGCISKLWIVNQETGKCVYNYDRGLDFSDMNPDDLEMIILICESLDVTKVSKRKQRITIKK